MGKYLLTKIGTAIFTSIVLSLLLAITVYTPLSEQREDTYHWSFLSLMMIYLIYSLPVIIIGGVPISILIDKYILFKSPILNFWIRTIVYGFAGALVFVLFLIVLSSGDFFTRYLDEIRLVPIGIIGAVLYFWIESIYKRVKRHLKIIR